MRILMASIDSSGISGILFWVAFLGLPFTVLATPAFLLAAWFLSEGERRRLWPLIATALGLFAGGIFTLWWSSLEFLNAFLGNRRSVPHQPPPLGAGGG